MWTIAARHRFWLAAWSVVAVTTLLAPQVASASKRDARVVAQPRLVWHKSFATAQAEARRRGVPLLIHFHARSEKKVAVRNVQPRLGLSGFSPVTLWTQKRWQRGDKKFACRVGGEIYYLASARELEQFRGDPSHFAPRLGGDDVVHRLDSGRRVLGSIRHAVFYDGGLYLFGDATTLARFLKSPTRFAITASRPAIGKR